MRFDDFDSVMRVYETSHDLCVMPGLYIVVRIDGRGFTQLTKKVMDYERPFDVRFRDAMVGTVKHLMGCGFNCLYGYTQSDEISILLSLGDSTFGRKIRKINSVMAGEASAAFTHAIGKPASFDCRVSQLPSTQLVIDYFRWRQQDAHRNALGGHCYYALRANGRSKRQATNDLLGLSVSEKNQLLFDLGTNFNDLPSWQKNGVGVEWEDFDRVGFNPKEGVETLTTRRRLASNLLLRYGDDYSKYVACFLQESAT
tara:strand:- start:410311 stop:411078 length:768 start_codon:yes stop_codon:yes gene_type:complete